MRIAVTDGNTRAALAITRSLGKAGHWVAVGEESRSSLAGSSKYCAEKFTYPCPSDNVSNAMEHLANEVKRHNVDLLIPVADKTLVPVLEFQSDLFDEIRIPFPDVQTLLRASDKFHLFRVAEECKVPIPRTIFVEKASEEIYADCCELEFPVVIKPARSIFRRENGIQDAGISYAHSPEEIRTLVNDREYLQEHQFLIQERVIGPGVGYFVLLDGGEPLAEFSHRRIREKPPSGGVSVYSESIAVRDDVREYSLTLLRELNWSGIAMVEFKLDHRMNKPVLMEINGRFWGSLQLAIDSGVDFPKLLVESGHGASKRTGAMEFTERHRWRWLMGDVDNLLLRCLKSKNELSLPPDYPSRSESLLNFLKAFGGNDTSYDVLKKNDLNPFLYEINSYLRNLIS
jgi:predicted ATP-grasp superfamily ATP-dependent carboligase